MKILNNKYNLLFMLMFVTGFCLRSIAQDSVDREMILSISYNLPNDNIPYLKITAREKIERKFFPLKDISANIYMGEESGIGLLGKIKTDSKGESKIFIPASFKSLWDSAASFTFIAVTEANKEFESITSEIEILKARIEIDTSSDETTKNITVKLSEFKNGEWMPAQSTDVRIVVKRLLGNLPVGEEETYTTDSSGMVIAEFMRDSLPGDSEGFFTLMARTDESDLYGNIFTEKIVPWGVTAIIDDSFTHRSLWAPRNKSPIWLLIIAYGIILFVWVTLIYLIIQILKVRKLGRDTTSAPSLTHLPDME